MTASSADGAAGCPAARPDRDGAAPAYVSYARMDTLHELAVPRSESPRELTFILISHVKELLFRVVHTEIDQARKQLRSRRPQDACASMERAVRAQRVLLASWDVMTAMTPDEFLTFRDVLGTASGTQSFMYRALEFSLGNKDPHSVRDCLSHLDRYPVLRAELDAPSLYDEALRYLGGNGLPVPAHVLERDVTRQYEADPGVEEVWLSVYRAPGRHPREHRLAEALTELSYQFSLWRANHLLVVERMLGSKPGTGGTSGLGWLRSINEHRFFPELWAARTRL
ncbi:tryptophan 2,3-dioxygenase [Streptomyces olivaceus]|uniref:tryptophan 2,3-dioxygenase n=1 Tax=Streptomyces olivaceus TaxID=47716 RepID=UPI001CCE478B|nr:tryptophan 2,3-dioxygenase family protein [Streptomyces olivaceus]